MKKIDILTIFPRIIDAYIKESIMARATEKKKVAFGIYDIRQYSDDKHNRVDDTPYGGGAGMVMRVAPIYATVKASLRDYKGETSNSRIILLSAKGKRYTQEDARRLTQYDHIILICGRYEGVDERVAKHIADEEISIGDFVLTGGELGALVIADSVVRLVPGVLGNADSVVNESYSTKGYKEHPHYTKPEEFNGWRVPDILLSGDHKKIAQWRALHSKKNKHVQKEK